MVWYGMVTLFKHGISFRSNLNTPISGMLFYKCFEFVETALKNKSKLHGIGAFFGQPVKIMETAVLHVFPDFWTQICAHLKPT